VTDAAPNPPSAFLTDAEVVYMTNAKRFATQRRALENYGIRFFTRNDGKPIVPITSVDLRDTTENTTADERFNL